MANFNDIKHEIDQNVNTNGVQAITGAILNETLKDMIDEVDEKKQDTLVAGQNITIQGNVISATGGGSGTTYEAGHGIDINHENPNDVISVDTQELAGYGLSNTDYQFSINFDVVQSKLTPGSNIQISNQGVISATDTKYYAGNGLNLSGPNTFSADTTVLATKSDLQGKQDTLQAGDGIEIDQNNEISVKAGTGLGFDANGYLINTGGGGGGTTYTAGDGIEIDSNDAINAKLGNGLQLDGSNNIEIDPSVVATQTDLAGKQDSLTEGQGIDIDSNNVISVDASELAGNGMIANSSGYLEPDFSVVASQNDLAGKQDTLVAGSNITINGNTISATDTNTTYSAGSGLNLNGTTFSVDTSAIQEKLTAGSNITITNNVISATGGSGATYTAGNGINIDQNNEISVDASDLAGNGLMVDQNGALAVIGGGGSGLWTSGTGTNSLMAPESVSSGATASGTGALNAGYYDSHHPGSISSASGDYSAAFGTGTWAQGDNSFVSGEANTAQGQRAFIGGGINNVASGRNSAVLGGDGGHAVGENTVSISGGYAGPGASAVAIHGTASAIGSVSINGTSEANTSTAIQGGHTYSGASGSVAIIGETDGQYSVAIGKSTHAWNENEVATGSYNKSYQSQTASIATSFTVGNGASGAPSNALEFKKNGDAYLVGVGGFNGTNAGQSGVITLQDAINNGGGSGTSFTPGDALELDANDNLNVLYGSGLTLNGNNELEVDPNSISGFLPLDGGQLQADPLVPATDTVLDILGPLGVSDITLDSGDNGDSNDPQGTATITMSDSNGYIQINTNGVSDGTYTASWPSLSADGYLVSNQDLDGYLPLTGGILQETDPNVSNTSLQLDSPTTMAYVSLGAEDEAGDIGLASLELGGNSGNASAGDTYGIYIENKGNIEVAYLDENGNYDTATLVLPQKSGTLATLDDIPGGGGSYTAGSGIDITNDVISVDTTTIQSKLTAGANIQINGNTISATDTNTTYSAGSGLNLNGTTFSADTTVLQEKLTAGSGISISGNTISATGGGGQSYSAGHGIDITNNTISVDASDLAGDFLPIQGGVLQNDSGTDTSLDIVSPGDGNVSISMQVFQDEANSQFQIDNNTVHEVVPGEGESISDFTVNNNGETGFALGVASFYVDDDGDWVRDVFESGEFIYSPAGQAMPAEIHLDTSSSNLSDPGNEDSEAKITIQDNRGYIEFNPTGFSDGTYTLSFPSLSQDETIATLSDIQGGGSYTAGSGIDITNDVISVDTTTIQEKLTAGQNITISGNVISASGGGGASYSAGSGIDITNNTISVDNTIATVSDLGGYLPLTGGTLQEDPNDSTSTELLIQSPETYATADLTTVDLDPGNTPESLAKLTLSDYDSSSNPHTAIYGTDGISDGTYKISFPTLTQDDTFALLSDVQGGGSGATYTAGSGINIDSNNVISNTAPSLWLSGNGSHSVKLNSTLTTANGAYACSIGRYNHADGADSLAAGEWANATGQSSMALGDNSVSTGTYSAALGYFAQASNEGATAVGAQSYAKNQYEVGIGRYNNSISSGTTAEKTQFTVGCGTSSNSTANLIEAKQNKDIYIYGVGGFTGTNASSASTLQAVLSGKQDTLTAGSGITITNNVISATGGGGGGSCLWSPSTGTNSLISPGAATGVSSDAAGTGAITVGYDSTADGDYAFAQGAASVASGLYSFAANNGTASGDYSAAFSAAGAYGDNSFAAGGGAIAGAAFSVSLGDGNVVFDDSDPNNVIDAQYGVAIGSGSVVEGEYGTAIGGGVASGEGSIALGSGSTADGLYDVAVAGGNSRGNYSFAASSGQTDSQGHYASALSGGYATGESSLASGQDTNAFGYSSIALGLGVNTYDQVDGSDRLDTNAGEVALGRYNYSESDIIFSIGCGYYDTEMDQEVRENSVAIDTDGNIFIKGIGGYTGQTPSGCTSLQDFLNNL